MAIISRLGRAVRGMARRKERALGGSTGDGGAEHTQMTATGSKAAGSPAEMANPANRIKMESKESASRGKANKKKSVLGSLFSSKSRSRGVAGRGVITVGEQSYAVGLVWDKARVKSKVVSEARAEGRKRGVDADFYVTRETKSTAQYGLGFKAYGHVSNLPVAGVILSEALKGTFLAAFQVPQGIWIVAYKDDIILPESDRLFDDEAKAEEHFRYYFNFGDWDTIAAPESWSVARALPVGIEELVSGDGRRAVLRPVYGLSPMARFGVLGASLLLLAGGGIYGMTKYQEHQDLLLQQEIQAQVAQKKAREEALKRQAEQVEIFPLPSEGDPRVLEHLQACKEAFTRITLSIDGWRVRSLNCTPKTVAANYSFDGLPYDILQRAALIRAPEARFEVGTDGQSATVSVPLPRLDKREAVAAGRFGDMVLELTRYKQAAQADVNIGALIGIEKPEEASLGTRKKDRVIMYYRSQVKITTILEPDYVLGLLDRLGGFSLEQVVFQAETKVWEISGSYYER